MNSTDHDEWKLTLITNIFCKYIENDVPLENFLKILQVFVYSLFYFDIRDYKRIVFQWEESMLKIILNLL